MKINTRINSVHFDADEKLLKFIQEKINKLSLFYDKIIDAEVFLRLENTQDVANKITEIKLRTPGGEHFAKKQGVSFEAATDQSIEALRKQIKKQKEKIKGV